MEKVRASNIESEKRIIRIQEWLLEDDSMRVMVGKIIDNGWCQSERHARRLLAAARKRWVADEESNMDGKREIAVGRLRDVIKKMPESVKNTSSGLRTLLAYEKEINKLEGFAVSMEPPRPKQIITINEML